MRRPVERPKNCECDNTHEQNNTCCMPCWNKGFRTVNMRETYKVKQGSTGYWVVDGKGFVEGMIDKPQDAADYANYCNAKADINEEPLSYKDFLEFNKSAN